VLWTEALLFLSRALHWQNRDVQIHCTCSTLSLLPSASNAQKVLPSIFSHLKGGINFASHLALISGSVRTSRISSSTVRNWLEISLPWPGHYLPRDGFATAQSSHTAYAKHSVKYGNIHGSIFAWQPRQAFSPATLPGPTLCNRRKALAQVMEWGHRGQVLLWDAPTRLYWDNSSEQVWAWEGSKPSV